MLIYFFSQPASQHPPSLHRHFRTVKREVVNRSVNNNYEDSGFLAAREPFVGIISKAIDDCIANDIMRDFLLENKDVLPDLLFQEYIIHQANELISQKKSR